MPQHGVFVENRLRAYLKKYDADVKVVAPVPWFPFQNETFGQYATWAKVPKQEFRHGIEVLHPRYFVPPKIAMRFSPGALSDVLSETIDDLAERGWVCDVIDAHYFYPDAVAAVDAANAIGKPVVVTARGSDISLIPTFRGPRKKIVNAALDADAIITVSDGLKSDLTDLGVCEEKISVLRNGVDTDQFSPRRSAGLRARLGISGPIITSVGHLIERKGHDVAIDAMEQVPGATLLIAGAGKLQRSLEKQAKKRGVIDRIRFLGAVAHEKLPEIYSATDAVVLASSREGWPNVLLEAMACGAPCIATDIPGSREVITDRRAGVLVKDRTGDAFGAAINTMLARPPDRGATRAYAAQYSWEETIDGMQSIFSRVANHWATDNSKPAAQETTTIAPATPQQQTPRLLVTVDAEEAFDWNESSPASWQVNDPEDIDRFQSMCAMSGATPLYFLSYPLLKDERTAGYYRTLVESLDAHCGLHLHSWATPPSIGTQDPHFSFQKNLPPALHARKLARLADQFSEVMGYRASAHRAGRYGVSPESYAHLAAIGIDYDFSPSPAFDFSRHGGPDFSALSNEPFAIAARDRNIVVTPVSGAKALRGTSFFFNQNKNAPGFVEEKEINPARFKTPMRLSPEGASLSDLKGLTRRLIADGAPVMTFTLHSTSLTKGANPYSHNAKGPENILDLSHAYFNWFQEELGGEFLSFDDLKILYPTSRTRAVA